MIMLPTNEKKFHPHSHDPREKGCTIDIGRRCKFLRPGDTYTDPRGRKYYVAEDGNLRRIKEERKV